MAAKVPTPLDYELPRSLKGIVNSWTPKLQAVAVVTALFAGIEAQLLSSLPAPGNHSASADTAVRFFAYTALLLNLGATLSAILLIIAVSSVPTAARQIYTTCSHSYPRKLYHNHSAGITKLNDRLLQGEGETYILRAFGIARGWDVMLRHCVLCFLLGCVSAFTHLGISVWLAETTLLSAIVMPVLLFGVVPPLIIYLFFMDSPRCDDCVEERYDA